MLVHMYDWVVPRGRYFIAFDFIIIVIKKAKRSIIQEFKELFE